METSKKSVRTARNLLNPLIIDEIGVIFLYRKREAPWRPPKSIRTARSLLNLLIIDEKGTF